MPDTRVYVANLARSLSPGDNPQPPPSGIRQVARELEPEGKYVAVSPHGTQVEIPKELFIALSDFIKTRKCPGAITIQFRGGEIVCVEAAAKKRYR